MYEFLLMNKMCILLYFWLKCCYFLHLLSLPYENNQSLWSTSTGVLNAIILRLKQSTKLNENTVTIHPVEIRIWPLSKLS